MNAPPKLSPRLVYVADDNPDKGEVIGFTLQMAGIRMRFFHNPETLLQALQQSGEKPDLLITDYQMPEMNGLELIQRCKAIVPGMKTISVSGTLGMNEIQGYTIQPDRNLAKPFQPRELLALVQELFQEG